MILEVEIKDTKWAVFHLIYKHSFNSNFPCIFFLWIIINELDLIWFELDINMVVTNVPVRQDLDMN